MSVIELKTEFHKLIDSVENEARLYFLGQCPLRTILRQQAN
jgi:hypothetical protein